MDKSEIEFLVLKFSGPLKTYLLIGKANSVATLKGLAEFQKKKNLDHFYSTI